MKGGKCVPTSSYDNNEKLEWKKFDQYSLSVIHSISVDEKRKRNAKKRQCDLVSYDIDILSENFLDMHVISDDDGHSGEISIEWLYEAMLNLSDNLKEVLLLKFWYKYSRKEISEKLRVSEKTIINWKNKAFEYIKNYRRRILERDIRGP